MFAVLVVSSIYTIVSGSIPVNVISNSKIESKSGRYTQIKLGLDNLALMVYNNEDCGCVGVAHCEDPFCQNITINHIDLTNDANNARFIYMKMSPINGLPQLSYAEQQSSSDIPSSLKFVSCKTINCSEYVIHIVYN